MNWTCKHFSDLTAEEFHDILRVRIGVFIIEQNCPYPEIDGKDKDAYHIFGRDDENEIVAVSRILKKGVSYYECSIGRVATSSKARLSGIGMEMMKFNLENIQILFGKTDVRISAQEYLKSFYEKFGFVKVSESYLEDDIPHIEMLRKNQD